MSLEFQDISLESFDLQNYYNDNRFPMYAAYTPIT